MYDIIVVGGGPAGLVAALYSRRANKSVLVIEKETFGGQITFSPKVENIPGFTELTGSEFAEKLVDQVINQGADFESAVVTRIRKGEFFTVETDIGEFYAKSVIIATGAKHRRLGVKDEEKYIGDGISFCAVCDGAFYKDKIVGVVGGGNSALQEALLLSELARRVYVIQNLSFLTGEEQLCNQLKAKDNVRILTDKTVYSFLGEKAFEGVVLRNEAEGEENGELTDLPLDGLFVAIGLIPQNEQFEDIVRLDKNGYIVSDENCLTDALGIFVAGDCRTKKVRQVTTATADGASAAIAACDYIDKLK
ncbi:MAG: NAD(P)/FAD-dependent oxidoreductase [Acutalibacteraceae bacterium]